MQWPASARAAPAPTERRPTTAPSIGRTIEYGVAHPTVESAVLLLGRRRAPIALDFLATGTCTLDVDPWPPPSR